MITQFTTTAAEMIATLNVDPAGHDPALPLRDTALLPADLPPDHEYRYTGRRVHEMLGANWMCRSEHTPPTQPGELLKLRERQYPDGTLERDAVRRHWQGHTDLPTGTPTYRKDALFSVKVQHLELRRLASLTNRELTCLGLRTLGDTFTFRNDTVSFPSPQATAAAHWGGRVTKRFPFVTDNPHMWLIRWDEPVAHLQDEERADAFTAGIANLDRLDHLLEHAERELRVLKNERDLQNERLARQMQLLNAERGDELLFVHGASQHRLGRYGASKLKNRPL